MKIALESDEQKIVKKLKELNVELTSYKCKFCGCGIKVDASNLSSIFHIDGKIEAVCEKC